MLRAELKLRYNTIPRYVMFSLALKLHKEGKKCGIGIFYAFNYEV